MADPKPPREGFASITDVTRKLGDRIRTLETASGTQRANLRAEVLKLFDDLEEQVQDQIDANSYTKAEINARIAAPSGNVSVAGILSSTGSRSNPIDTFRTVVWREDGTDMGYSSSTRRVKQDIVDHVLPEVAFRSVRPREFRYIAQVAELGDDARTDVGFIAEELVEAGISEPVYFDAEGIPEGVNYDRLTPFLWGMMQQLLDDRDDLRGRLDALENGV